MKEFPVEWKLYIVKARQIPGTMHTITSPHLLTESPGAGDEIVKVISGRKGLDLERQIYTFASLRCNDGKLLSHAGRSAMLGEDGLESASGNDALEELARELLEGAEWRYAPVEWAPDAEDACTTEVVQWNIALVDGRMKATRIVHA